MTESADVDARAAVVSAVDSTPPEAGTYERRLASAAARTAAAVSGVHRLGGTAAGSLARASRAVLGTSITPGVSVARVDGVVFVDLDVVVEYPSRVREVADRARAAVERAAAGLADERVVVDVTVTDVHGPFDPVEVPEEEAPVDSARATSAGAAETTAAAVDALRDGAAETPDAPDSSEEEPAIVVETPDVVVRVEIEPVDGTGASGTGVDHASDSARRDGQE